MFTRAYFPVVGGKCFVCLPTDFEVMDGIQGIQSIEVVFQ